jgi:hypothetical protein
LESFLSSNGEAWAKRDLAGAVDWTQAHLKGKNRVEWCEKCFQAGIVQDFDATIRTWQDLPVGYAKKRIADAMLRATPDSRKAEAEALLHQP